MPPERPADRLLLDTMLGKLATYLRMCGYDAAYVLDSGLESDDAILDRVAETDRRLVTRDEQLAARAPDAVLLASLDVDEQLEELAERGYDLSLPDEPARCGICNAKLERVPTDEPTPEYAPDPPEPAVWRCTECGQHFWKGSHWDDVGERLPDVG